VPAAGSAAQFESSASAACPFPGAQQWSILKGCVLGSTFAAALALEAWSPPGAPTERLLQPAWDLIVAAGTPYIHNSLFAVTVATVTYVTVCGYFTLLDLRQHAPTKLQKDWYPSAADMFAAAWPQLLFYGAGQAQIWYLWKVYPEKYTAALPQSAPSVLSLCAHLSLCLLLGDFFIYWEHRLMHTVPYLRTRIHSVHHEYTAVFSWAGGWVHPLEDLVVVACQCVPVLLLAPHPLTQWLFACLWVICLIDEHSGHDVWWSPYQLLPFTGVAQGGGAAPHDIHHYKPTKNYGFVFIIWDRLFGTFEEVQQAANPYVPPFCKAKRPKPADARR